MNVPTLHSAVEQLATRVQFVRYYVIPATNRKKGIAVTFGKWPARVLRHRGYTPERQIYLRVATPDEHEQIAESMRHEAMYYPTVEGLLADEQRVLPAADYAVLARCLTSAWDRAQEKAA